MSEQDAAATEQPTTDTPDQGTGTTQDWEQRYQELQPAYTRATQEAAELRQWQEQIRTDPDAQKALLTELGYDVADDTPIEDPYGDRTPAEIAQLRQELEQLKQGQSQIESDRQIAQVEQHFSQAFQTIGTDRGAPLSEEEQNAVMGIALTMPPSTDGLPPVKEAFSVLEKIREADQQRWASSKRTPHTVAANGAAGTEQPNLDNESERVAWMAQRLADLNNG